MHEAAKAAGCDLLMANTHGKSIADDEKIAFVRLEFPVYDRVGYQRRAIIGYNGGINLIDLITNSILGHGDM